MNKFEIKGLHHLALVCKDMERTVDFYTNILGMPLTKGFDLQGYGQHFFFDMGNGSELGFFWFNDAPASQPGVASAKNIVGSTAVNHNDVVTGEESRTGQEASEKTWLQSFYFFDPDGVMLEFCATLQPGLTNVDLPVNAHGIKANGKAITGVTQET